MSKVVIKAENISKQYRLGLVGTGTVKDDMKRWWYNLRGKEDPFLKIGEANDRASKGESDYVWSLRDINFEINQGDSVGIIGRNGAGKSTLLKILSQVTQPTTGKIYTKGRIASLLEVGTGFHPEMTGRENIYLNGAILGMRNYEITRKIDEIIAFSGVERYIDTPVKRYSSGMYVRLAFAVAAHLESEILIVDEVLAVGDAEFQKKCLGKMNDVSKGEGRTVLFVSHNIAAVNNLCNKVIMLDNGQVVFAGDTDKGIDYYLKSNHDSGYVGKYSKAENVNSGIMDIALFGKNAIAKTEFEFDESILIKFKIKLEEKYLNAHLGFRVIDKKERVIFTSEQKMEGVINTAGEHIITVNIPANILVPSSFKLTFGLHIPNVYLIDYLEECLSFEIVETGSQFHMYQGNDFGCVYVECNWSLLDNKIKF